MATTLEEPLSAASMDRGTSSAAQRLRTQSAAVRLSFNWLGTSKTLNAEQKAQAADTFGAEHDCLSASKRLLDVKHPAFKAVSAVKNRTTSYWKGVSLPFPEPGVRLIRQDGVEAFNLQMQDSRDELEEAVGRLNEHFEEMKAAARERLGSLYDAGDYPTSIDGLFAVSWEFVSLEPPPYLLTLSPDVYQQEVQRVQARFDESVQLAEQAFTEELHALVAHLTERLTGQTDGKAKVFRDSAVNNITKFFARFRELNVGGNDELDQLVDDCRQLVRGVEPQTLRDNPNLRTRIAEELSAVEAVLDGLLVDRPRRNILRRPR